MLVSRLGIPSLPVREIPLASLANDENSIPFVWLVPASAHFF
jgi:hypothetical protein